MNKHFRLATILLTLVVLAGCNTIRGVGRDVERAGEVIQGRSAQVERAPPTHAAP